MATTVIATPRFQSAAKKLPTAESRILGEFLRLVIIMGVNPNSAAGSAHAKSQPVAPADKEVAFGGTTELVISSHNRVFYRYSGPAITFTNLAPIAAPH